MTRELLEGNRALAEAALRYGLQAYFGYPITPQSEVLEHLSRRMIQEGRAFLQAESELAAINMVYGAACTGVRAMTSTSGPGFSLMTEGLSYIACSEVPAVVVNMQRGGPGLGNIQPSQGDYFLMTKTAGHGDFRPIVLAPATVQELIDMIGLAFELAERYRTLVFVAGDANLGQMMESAELPPMQPLPEGRPNWAVTGAKGRAPRHITSLYLNPPDLEAVNQRLQAKLAQIKACEQRWVEVETEDAEWLLVAYGTTGRIGTTVVREARARGARLGLLRPQTLWPLAESRLAELGRRVRGILMCEMNAGQMVEDVRRVVGPGVPVEFYGRSGGMVPLVDEILIALGRLGVEQVGVTVPAEEEA